MTVSFTFALAAAVQGAPASNVPPAHPMTLRSGGAISPERVALRLRHADLAIETLPTRQMLSARATLTLTAHAGVPRLTIDLDDALPVSRSR